MSAILRWLLTQATRGVLGQIIKSVLVELGVWKFVVAVPIAVYVAVMAMAEGSQSVAVALMFVVAAATLVLLHYATLGYERIREKYFGGGKEQIEHRTPATESDEPAPPTWFELEQRFRELEAPLQFMRIDGQTGAAGEHWRLAGGPSGDAGRRFHAVAAMASTRLFQDFPSEIRRFSELESESDPVIRWYKALQFIADRYEDYRYAEQINDDGSSGGFIFTGSIDQPATASATLCLELASRPIEQT